MRPRSGRVPDGAVGPAAVMARLRSTAIETLVTIALLVLAAAPSAAIQDKIPPVAFFGFSLINTSLEPTTPAEQRRLTALDDLIWCKSRRGGVLPGERLAPLPSLSRKARG
jgi:hypothetical protein